MKETTRFTCKDVHGTSQIAITIDHGSDVPRGVVDGMQYAVKRFLDETYDEVIP